MPLEALKKNQKSQTWTKVRKPVNVEKLCRPFLRGQPLKIPHGILLAILYARDFFFFANFFAPASFSLNNICLFVCLLFFFRMLSDNPVEFIGSEAFTNAGHTSLLM